ncbi:unnamed protein product [Trichogramma brassicae]|uniref:Uncharacterized protein n=1 Tax=Trichogramma brassicae TaxID=86971 RepID=A0A6H5IUH0_9HYME|nr:unnamed protein product [Trichogramma brassicae]
MTCILIIPDLIMLGKICCASVVRRIFLQYEYPIATMETRKHTRILLVRRLCSGDFCESRSLLSAKRDARTRRYVPLLATGARLSYGNLLRAKKQRSSRMKYILKS